MINQRIMALDGIRVFTNPLLTDTVVKKWCKSKKKRIRKKWAKNPKNLHEIPSRKIIRLDDGSMVLHPVMLEEIKKMGG